jgi:hypothetical protein
MIYACAARFNVTEFFLAFGETKQDLNKTRALGIV